MAVDDMRPVCSQSAMVDIKEEQPYDSGNKSVPIHSGHFMVSRVHDDDVNNDDDEEEVKSPFNDDAKEFDFLSANKEISTTYNFSNATTESVGIDVSLTKLFECMTLAYSGKITSPRWKQFRGMHLTQKQRIRLNNLIWREWHMQYIYGKLPIVCQFATPLSDHIHSKPEAVVLEGKYWKRQLDTVTAEYKKWRRFCKERNRHHQHINFKENSVLNEWELLERVKDVTFIAHCTGNYTSNTDLNLLQTDVMDMDFTNDLFANLNQPFAFPNPRELSQLGYADLIQPGLVQLQPNLEEFMDIDSMQEFFSARLQSAFVSPYITDSSPNIDMGSMQNSDILLDNFLMSSSGSVNMNAPTENNNNNNPPATPIHGNMNTSFVTGNLGGTQNIMLQLTSGGHYQIDPATILLGASLSHSSPQTFTIVPTGLYNNIQNIVTSSASNTQKPVSASLALSSSDLLTHLLQQQQSQLSSEALTSKRYPLQQSHTPIQPAPSLNLNHQRTFQPSISLQSPILAQSLSIQQQQQPQSSAESSHTYRTSSKLNKHPGSNDNLNISSGLPKTTVFNTNLRKDGPFTIPTSKPVTASRKNRIIAPAPSSAPPQQNTASPSPSSQASYLAELLKNGTYPGALISVKKETQLTPTVSSPIKTTTNLYPQARSSQGSGFNQHMPGSTMVTNAAANSIQTSLSSVAGNASTAADASLIPNQDLSSMIMSSGLTNLHSKSHPIIKESPFRFSMESKVTSPVNHLPKSPVASPPLIKRTPSPVPSMDSSSYVDPLSPFSSSMSMSPSNNVSQGDPDSPGSGDSFPLDNRRAAHLSAEQKRRCNLKTGFDMLQQLVPSLSQNPKVSKATMLQKTAEYCKKLKVERSQMQKEATILKQEIDTLNSAISNVQSQLPETGVPVTRQRKDQMKEMFDEYVRIRTNENSKFWIFSVIMNALFDSYCNTVSTASIDELCRTSLTWLDQSCSLVTLRPNVLNALRKLSTSTPILTEPQKMKEHALQAVAKQTKGQRGNIGMTK